MEPGGFEPPTFWLPAKHSSQLSYGPEDAELILYLIEIQSTLYFFIKINTYFSA